VFFVGVPGLEDGVEGLVVEERGCDFCADIIFVCGLFLQPFVIYCSGNYSGNRCDIDSANFDLDYAEIQEVGLREGGFADDSDDKFVAGGGYCSHKCDGVGGKERFRRGRDDIAELLRPFMLVKPGDDLIYSILLNE